MLGDDEFRIEPYLDITPNGNDIYAMNEETVLKEGVMKNLLPITDYKVDKDFLLVLRVEYLGGKVTNDIGTMKITYKKFGVNQQQMIPFNGFFPEEK